MDATLFIEQFGHLADAPKGIEKLRKLILDLAVRGQLVPQNPDDEPASELLKRIEAEKKRRIKASELKPSKPLPPVREDEIPYTLPQGWAWTRLGKITNYGETLKIESHQAKNDLWILDLEDIEKTTSRIIRKVNFRERGFQSTKNYFEAGNVLYGKLRPYLDKVIVADENGACTTEIIPFHGFGFSNAYYLRWVLKSPQFIDYATRSTHGMNLPRLGTDKARLAYFPLPPLAEQERIVAKVDELMALCDQLEIEQQERNQLRDEATKSTLHHLINTPARSEASHYWHDAEQHFPHLFDRSATVADLRATILQLAVQGRLVPQNPDDEPAGELLKQIEAEKKRLIKVGEIKASKILPPIQENEVLYALPHGWIWLRVGDILTFEYGKSLPTKVRNDDGEFPVYGSNGIVGFHDKYLIDRRGIIIGRKGSSGAINISKSEFWATDVTYYVLPSDNLSFNFIVLLLQSLRLEHLSKGIKPGLNRNEAYLLPIALPPLAEQERIVAKVDELMALCDQLDEAIKEEQALSGELFDSIVYHLFEEVK